MPAILVQVLFAVLIAAASFGAAAQQVVRPGEEKVTVVLGAFLPAFKTNVQVDNDQVGRGDNVDLANDLGVRQDSSGGLFGAEWRFAPRHRIGLTYSRFTLTGERVIDRSLQIGDEVFPVGATVSSRLRLQIIPIAYSYSVVKREHDELAVTAGLHWSRLAFSVQGSASLATQDASNDANAKANVPLPLLGLRYDHHFLRALVGRRERRRVRAGIRQGEVPLRGRIVEPAAGRRVPLCPQLQPRRGHRRVPGKRRREPESVERRFRQRLLGPADLPERAVLAWCYF
jgi:hypothetical protein